MTIFSKLKSLKLDARKNKDMTRVDTFSYLQGEIERQFSNPTNAEVTPLIRNVEKRLAEDPEKNQEDLLIIREFIRENLPSLMSRNSLYTILENNDLKTIGEAMKYLKLNYPDQYDNSEVAQFYKK